MSVSERLRELRGDKTLADMAKAFNITDATWGHYETGIRTPRDEMKKAIADYFGKSVQEIFFD